MQVRCAGLTPAGAMLVSDPACASVQNAFCHMGLNVHVHGRDRPEGSMQGSPASRGESIGESISGRAMVTLLYDR